MTPLTLMSSLVSFGILRSLRRTNKLSVQVMIKPEWTAVSKRVAEGDAYRCALLLMADLGGKQLTGFTAEMFAIRLFMM